MTNLPAPTSGGEYAGPVAFLMAAAALVKSLFTRGLSQHKVRNLITETVGPLLPRVAVLESKYKAIDHRLERIEDKLDRVLER